MGYTLTIGNAYPVHSIEDGELYAEWDVKGFSDLQAPVFPNDEMTGNTSQRSPSYTAWHEFCQDVGLEDLFYHRDEGLIRSHPGTFILTAAHSAKISEALAAYPRSLPPGFAGFPKQINGEFRSPDEGKYDHQLARLLWLDFWVRYALERCETPALRNT